MKWVARICCGSVGAHVYDSVHFCIQSCALLPATGAEMRTAQFMYISVVVSAYRSAHTHRRTVSTKQLPSLDSRLRYAKPFSPTSGLGRRGWRSWPARYIVRKFYIVIKPLERYETLAELVVVVVRAIKYIEFRRAPRRRLAVTEMSTL